MVRVEQRIDRFSISFYSRLVCSRRDFVIVEIVRFDSTAVRDEFSSFSHKRSGLKLFFKFVRIYIEKKFIFIVAESSAFRYEFGSEVYLCVTIF